MVRLFSMRSPLGCHNHSISIHWFLSMHTFCVCVCVCFEFGGHTTQYEKEIGKGWRVRDERRNQGWVESIYIYIVEVKKTRSKKEKKCSSVLTLRERHAWVIHYHLWSSFLLALCVSPLWSCFQPSSLLLHWPVFDLFGHCRRRRRRQKSQLTVAYHTVDTFLVAIWCNLNQTQLDANFYHLHYYSLMIGTVDYSVSQHRRLVASTPMQMTVVVVTLFQGWWWWRRRCRRARNY